MGVCMKLFLTLGLFVSLLQVSANELKIKKVKELGPMKHRVIFQSENLKPTKRKNEYTGLVVLRWGVYVYEAISAKYRCSSDNLCSIVSYERLQTFENCSVKNNKVKCIKPLSGSSDSSDDSVETDTSSPDLVVDEFDNDRRDSSESDFPERSSGEYDDLF